jgi:integrative and conjugative element protein (TIGR02256 family)
VALTTSIGEPATSVVGRLDGADQLVVLDAAALRHVQRHRQTRATSTEAGGQLFGTIELSHVRVLSATGPYAGDERTRYRYRSNPRAAQLAIDQQAARGLLYLGEWHTHAEDTPNSSSLDQDAMRKLIAGSRLNSNGLLLLIVGRLPNEQGLALWSVSPQRICEWRLSSADMYPQFGGS